MAKYIEVGRALTVINERRLYRANYKYFSDYYRERWGMHRSRTYRLIDASRVAAKLSTIVDSEVTLNECQLRPLVRLSDAALTEEYKKIIKTTGKPSNRSSNKEKEKKGKIADNDWKKNEFMHLIIRAEQSVKFLLSMFPECSSDPKVVESINELNDYLGKMEQLLN